MANRIQQISRLGQSIWLDFISRDLLDSGELRRLINEGVSGMTSNPTIFQKSISTGTLYDDQIRELANAGRGVDEIYEAVAMRDIGEAADALRGLYEEKDGRDGFVSIEVNPAHASDTAATIDEGRRLFAALERPNIMIKVPATEAGIPAVRALIAAGVNVNVTLIFSIAMYERVMQAYIDGLSDRVEAERPIGRIASVASFFVSRVDSAVDKLIAERAAAGVRGIESLVGQAAIANAKIAYDRYKHVFEGQPFSALRRAGARVQRPLWASTSTKNPAYSDTKYIDTLIGPDTVNTVPPGTLEAIRERATPARTIDMDTADAYAVVERLGAAGINMNAVTATLLEEGVKSFADSFAQMMRDIEAKRAALTRPRR